MSASPFGHFPSNGIVIKQSRKVFIVSDKTKQLKMISIAYMVIVGGYILYGFIFKTGLYALMVDEQLKRFGRADDRLAVFIPFIILLLPVAPLTQYVRRQERLARLQKGQSPHSASGSDTSMAKRPQWAWIIALSVAPFLISLVAYLYVTAVNVTDQSRAMYHMDLAKNSDVPAGDVKFIEISGVLQQDSEYFLTEEISGMKTGQSYRPLTDTAWNPSQPVKYILHVQSEGGSRVSISHYDKQTGKLDFPPPTGPFKSTFGGQLSKDGLPDYVKSGLERKGIKTTEPYYVLDWRGDMNVPMASSYNSQMYYLIPFLGAFFSVVVLTGFGIAHINRKRYQDRKARLGQSV